MGQNATFYTTSGYGIAFDGKDQWSFCNDYARNVVIFGIDTSSSSHIDNPKNEFLILGEGVTFGINGSFGAPERKFSINFTKANTKFCLSLHYTGINSNLLMDRKSISLKLVMETTTFQLGFVLEVYLIDLVLLSLEKYL